METISKVLPLLAGIGMFLYGMNLMASSIEKLAGAKQIGRASCRERV